MRKRPIIREGKEKRVKNMHRVCQGASRPSCSAGEGELGTSAVIRLARATSATRARM